MHTILRIIERAGGWNSSLSHKIEDAPHMALTIEAIEEGPPAYPPLSLTTANRWRLHHQARLVLDSAHHEFLRKAIPWTQPTAQRKKPKANLTENATGIANES